MPHRSLRHRPAIAGLALAVSLGTLLSAPGVAQATPGTPGGLQALGEVDAGLPVLSWKPVAAAASYQVQVGDDDFDSPLFTVDTDNVAYAWNKVVPPGTHVWRVRSVGADKSLSAWSQGEFDVDRSAAPTPSSPANGAVLAQPEEPPLLQWSVVPGAIDYVVQVDDEDQFADAAEYDTAATSIVVPDPLSPDKPYFWRVKAVRGTGIESAYSATRSFTLGALAVPQVVSPDSSPSNDVTDVVLDWRPVAGARYYELQVSTDDDFADATIIDSKTKITGTRYSPKVTYDNNQYYWRVRAVSGANTTVKSDWSPSVNQFRRSWNTRPEAVYPLTTTEEVADPFFYQWTPVDHATQYELQVGDDPNFSPGSFESCQTAATTYTPALFAYNLTTSSDRAELCYPNPGGLTYWRVRALDLPFRQPGASVPGVQGIYSETQSFVYDPAAFSPTDDGRRFTPAGGETVDVPTLRWQPTLGGQAQTYRVFVVDKTGSTVVNTTTYADSYTITKKLDVADGPFRWSVSAIEADGRAGSLVHTSSFQVSGNAPAVDGTPLTATEGTGNTQRTPHLAWVPYPGAVSYRVRILRAGSDVAIDAGSDLMNKALAYNEVTETSKLFMNTASYDWIVSAVLSDGSSVSGPRSTFTIDALSAVTGQHLALDGATLADGGGCVGSTGLLPGSTPDTCPDLPATPVLSWDPVDGASFYVVYMSQDDRFTNLLEATSSMSATSNTFFTPTLKARNPTYPDSQAGASYYWHVRPCKTVTQCAVDPVSASSSLATNRFRKKSPVITGATAVAGTGDGSEVTFAWDDYLATNAATTWSPTGETSGQAAKLYRLQVARTPSFAAPLLEQVDVDQPTYTSFDKLYADGPVYWRVQAVDANDNELALTPTMTYAKESPAVQLTAPVGNAEISGSVPLQWQAQPYAQAYQVQVAANNDANFSSTNILFDETTAQSAYTWDEVVPAATTPYVWRVRRIDSVGNAGVWSTPRRFASPGSSPTLVTPKDGAAVPASRALFYWSLVPGATSYRVEIRQGSRATTYTTSANAYAPTSPFSTGSRTWRVVALDANRDPVGASATRSFTVDATRPEITKVTPRGTVPRQGSIKLTFSERVTGVSSATVKLFKRGSKKPVAVRVTLASTRRTATIKPRARLARSTSYELVVTAGVRDLYGNAIRQETIRFRTPG